MKKIILVPFIFLFYSALFSQEMKEFKLNSYFKKETIPQFITYIRKAQPYDTLWSYTDYNKGGKIIQTGFYTDTNFITPVGHSVFYLHGTKLYEGNYLNGRPAGYWYFFNEAGNVTDSLYYTFRDTTKKPAVFKDALATGKPNELKNEHLKKDTSAPALQLETPAGFPGGTEAWRKYLTKNLFVPNLVIESSPYSKGTVYVQFVVCKDGEVCSVEALNSVHPLVDLIAVKAIRKGPRWEPAVQRGKNVKAYHRQPITFILEDY
jgi:Gram-negative bacterial TonB protein C-terminal